MKKYGEPSGDLYYFGTEGVFRGTKQAATTTTLTPIRYTYYDHNLEIVFQAGIADVYVGQILVITRTMSWRDQSGSEPLRFYVTRVEKGTDLVRIFAADPIGYLGIMMGHFFLSTNRYGFLALYLPALGIQSLALIVWHDAITSVVVVIIVVQSVTLAALTALLIRSARRRRTA